MKRKGKREKELRFDYFYWDPNLFYQYPEEELTEDSKRREDIRLLDIQLGAKPDYLRREFEAGREEAIYDFVRTDPFCFQSLWVTDQIEKWRIENSFKSIIKLRRLFSAYIPEQRGKTAPEELRSIVKRDQTVYLRILELRKVPPKRSLEEIVSQVAGEIADRDWRNEQSVWLIYKSYNKAAKELFDGDEKEFIRYLKKNPLDRILKRAHTLELSMDYRCSYCQGKVVFKEDREKAKAIMQKT